MYLCELCEPNAPVHVGRELVVRRKEEVWKDLVKKRGHPHPSPLDGKRKKEQDEGEGGRKRRKGQEGEGRGRGGH